MPDKELGVTKINTKWLCINRANVTCISHSWWACGRLEYYMPSGLELPRLAALLYFIVHLAVTWVFFFVA